MTPLKGDLPITKSLPVPITNTKRMGHTYILRVGYEPHFPYVRALEGITRFRLRGHCDIFLTFKVKGKKVVPVLN
jgi:hypothetical protein